MQKIDILVAGVGGQGTILTGKIISKVALHENMDIKTAETHGMAPVSYTHLDVYKRQSQNRSAASGWRDRRAGPDSSFQERVSGDPISYRRYYPLYPRTM